MGQTVARYRRVSTADQTCARQQRDLRAFAKKAGYKLFGVWKEPAGGEGQSYREISQRLGLSKNTILDIVKRERAA